MTKRTMLYRSLWAIAVLYPTAITALSPITLKTTVNLPSTITSAQLHRFLGVPENWPDIVASSHSVVRTNDNGSSSRINGGSNVQLSLPLRVGKSVDEIFGLPPVLPLTVTWKCLASIAPTATRNGRLEYSSAGGLAGVAKDCRMKFHITQENNDNSNGCSLELEMCYTPVSLLAVAAVPLLMADNTLALKVLLPLALRKAKLSSTTISISTSTSTSTSSTEPESSLQEFRNLMGALYGVAGLAHAADCLLGPSTLLVAAGAPEFSQLPPAGQAYALLWCATGPLAFAASRVVGYSFNVADLGLVVYGLVEIGGALLIGSNDVVVNAVGVQAVVALAWLYSSQKMKNSDAKV